MKRRELLSALGISGFAGFSGCLNTDSRESPTTEANSTVTEKQTPTLTPISETIGIDDTIRTEYGSLWLDRFSVQQSVTVQRTHRTVLNRKDRQYLLFDFYAGNANDGPEKNDSKSEGKISTGCTE